MVARRVGNVARNRWPVPDFADSQRNVRGEHLSGEIPPTMAAANVANNVVRGNAAAETPPTRAAQHVAGAVVGREHARRPGQRLD
jgi:hypothetical protein